MTDIQETSNEGYRDADEYLYVPARGFDGGDRKKPTCRWVNDCPDDIDPRSIDNPHVLAYEETKKDEPYIIVGLRDGYALDIDVDVGEDHDETFDGDIDDIRTPDGMLVFRSPSGGWHAYPKCKQEHQHLSGIEGVDLQGDMSGNLGVVASPFHHPEYELVNVPDERVTYEVEELNDILGVELLEFEDNESDDSSEAIEVVDERTQTPSSDFDDFDEYLTVDDIEDALNHLDAGEFGYKHWRNHIFAIHDFDTELKDLAIEWSEQGSKWDESSREWIDKFWKQANDNPERAKKRRLGTLIDSARDNGWSMPSPSNVGAEGSNIREQDGCYGYWSQADDEWQFDRATNFTLDVESILEHEDETYYHVRVESDTGETYDVQVKPTVFNEWRTFKEAVVIGRSTAVWTPRNTQTILNDLRLLVNEQDAPTHTGVTQFGIHGDELVTPSGVLGPDGWKDTPEHVLIETGNPLESAIDVPEDGDEEAVASMLELLPQTRSLERFTPVLGWFYAVPFRSIVMDEEGQFNHLGIGGTTGSGKSSTISVMSQMFGMSDNGFNAPDTSFTRLRTLAGARGLPVWFDEYKPTDWASYQRDGFHADIRKASNGQVAQRGRADQTVTGYTLSAPVVLTGEQRIQGGAEQRRSLQTRFITESTHGEFRDAYNELRKHDLRAHARVFYQWVLQQDEEDVRELWNRAGERVAEELSVESLDDTSRQAIQTAVFGMNVFRSFAQDIGADVPEVPVWDSLQYVVDTFTGEDARTSFIDDFVSVLERAALNGYLTEDVEYTFVHKGKSNEELRVNPTRALDQVSKYVRDHNLDVSLFNTGADYTAHFDDNDAEWIIAVQQNSPPIGRAISIDLDATDALSRRAFSGNVEGNTHTIVGRVLELDSPANGQEQRGQIRTTDGEIIEFISWSSQDPPLVQQDSGYEFADVTLDEYQGNTQLTIHGYSELTNLDTEGTTLTEYDSRREAIETVLGDSEMRRDILCNAVAELGYEPARVDDAIDTMLTDGRLQDLDGALMRV